MIFKTNIKTNLIPDIVEKKIIDTIDKNPPQCYNFISEIEIKNLFNLIINNPSNIKYSIDIDQIISIRSSFIKNRMIKTYFKLVAKSKKIIELYNKKYNIIELSKRFDGSPLTIIRIIFNKKYYLNIKKIFNNPDKLLSYDREQFNLAKQNDIFALINQDSILLKSIEFEKKIEIILKKLNIVYKTQEQLAKEQIKKYGKALNTPDFLILSDLIINNNLIKWIDAKNFYGSNINFIRDGIIKQTKKYIDQFGQGCIIFSLGYNDIYHNNNILFLSYNSFVNLTPNI